MSETTGDTGGLYGLLPEIFRLADSGQGYPLFALLAVFERVRAELDAGVSAMTAAWFIETCPPALVPLIGALLGVDVGAPVTPEQRPLVADTLGLRRRKGTAPALPRLVRDVAGWAALYQPGRPTPASSWPLPGVAGVADGLWPPPPPGLPPPVAAGCLRVWRLPAFAAQGVTPAARAPYGGVTFQYSFNPLALAQPLFTLPAAPLGWLAAPPVTALPAPLTTAMLAADLARVARGETSLFYGAARGLVIRTQASATADWEALPVAQVRAGALAGLPAAPDYPVLRGAAIAPGLPASVAAYRLSFGDAAADLSVEISANATMAALAAALRAAIANAAVTPGTLVDAASVRALIVGIAGSALAILPTLSAGAALALAPAAAGGPDPLRLAGSARLGIAAASLALAAASIAALTTGAAAVLGFATPDGQNWSVPLPLAPAHADAAGIAAAIGAVLTSCFVTDIDQRIVVVPSPVGVPPVPVAPSAIAAQLGLVPAVTIDPAGGQFSWPSAWPVPAALRVDYGMAMPMAIGGAGPAGADEPAPADDAVYDGGDPGGLSAALAAWASAQPANAVLVMQGAATRALGAPVLALAAGQRLRIETQAASAATVSLAAPGTLTLTGAPAGGAAGEVALARLVLSGGLALGGGELAVALTDVTLYPGPQTAALAATATPAAGSGAVTAARCVLGPIDMSRLTGTFAAQDSVLGALDSPVDLAAAVLTAPAAVGVTLARVTLLGAAVLAGALTATDTLFAGPLQAGAVQLVDCYVALLTWGEAPAAAAGAAVVTRCATCLGLRGVAMTGCLVGRLTLTAGRCACTDTASEARDCATCTDAACAAKCGLRTAAQDWTPLGPAPRFVAPNAYPGPNYARLADDNPAALLTGATNRDQIGAYNAALPSTRLARFGQGLRDHLLFGVGLEVFFET